jgi:pentatricopeptide repeat protein
MYGAAIHGFGHVGDDHKAERLFHVMIKDFEHGNESALPSTRILNMVLFALLRSSDTAAPERALKILGEIEALSRVGWFNAFPDDRSLSLAIQILSKDPTGKYTNEITDFHDQRKRLGKFSRQRRS